MAETTEKATLPALFRNHVVRTILLSAFFLQIGIWVRNYAILLYVMERTNGNSVAVSLISFAEFAPIFLFSFIGGTFADRWRPKRTMVLCDLLSSISVFIVLVTLQFASWKAIFFTTLVSSVLSQFSQPSGLKLFKLHVSEQLMQLGMSMYQTLFAVFMILGPIVGTFIYQHYGINAAVSVMGIAFLLSAGVLLMLPPDRVVQTQSEKPSLAQEMKAGLQYVLRNRSLTLLGGTFTAAGLGIGIIQPLTVFLVTERLGLPKEQLQWLMAANGIAMIAGGAVTMGLAKNVAPQKLLIIGMTVSAIGIFIMGLSNQFPLTLAGQFISGLVMPCIQIGINTLILKNTEADFVGRVNGILNPLFTGAMVIMMSISGWLMHLFSLVTMFEAATVLFLIGIVVILPLLRQQTAELETP